MMNKSLIGLAVITVVVWFVIGIVIKDLGINFGIGVVGVIIVSLVVSVGFLVWESRGERKGKK